MTKIDEPWMPIVVSLLILIVGYVSISRVLGSISPFSKKRWAYSEQSDRFNYKPNQKSKINETLETLKRVKS